MLLFLDFPKWIKILREVKDGEGKRSRDLVGAIAKADLDVPPALNGELSSRELQETERVLQLYREADAVEARYWALKLPVILRRVTDYYASTEDEDERKLVRQAILQALMAVRRTDRRV